MIDSVCGIPQQCVKKEYSYISLKPVQVFPTAGLQSSKKNLYPKNKNNFFNQHQYK